MFVKFRPSAHPLNVLLSGVSNTPYALVIPTLGILCSQHGNVIFPAWEYLIGNNALLCVKIDMQLIGRGKVEG